MNLRKPSAVALAIAVSLGVGPPSSAKASTAREVVAKYAAFLGWTFGKEPVARIQFVGHSHVAHFEHDRTECGSVTRVRPENQNDYLVVKISRNQASVVGPDGKPASFFAPVPQFVTAEMTLLANDLESLPVRFLPRRDLLLSGTPATPDTAVLEVSLKLGGTVILYIAQSDGRLEAALFSFGSKRVSMVPTKLSSFRGDGTRRYYSTWSSTEEGTISIDDFRSGADVELECRQARRRNVSTILRPGDSGNYIITRRWVD